MRLQLRTSACVAVDPRRRRLGAGGARRPRQRSRPLPRPAARRGAALGPPGGGDRPALGRRARHRRRLLPGRGHFSRHEFDVVGNSLLRRGALTATAYIQQVPASERAALRTPATASRSSNAGLDGPAAGDPRGLSTTRSPTPSPSAGGKRRSATTSAPTPAAAPYLRRARDTGKPTATAVMPLLIGGAGINVYRPVYRDGAPTSTRRRAACRAARLRRRRLPRHRPGGGGDRGASRRASTSSSGPAATRVVGPDGDARRRGRGRRSRSPTGPGSWSSATPTGPRSACRC